MHAAGPPDPASVSGVRIHSAEAAIRHPWRFVRHMAADIVATRETMWHFFVIDFRAQHRGTLFGYVWLCLPPIAAAIPWLFLDAARVINVSASDVPYACFVLIGTSLWQSFIDALNAPLSQMAKSKHLLTKLRIPGEVFLLGGLADVLLKCAVRGLLIALVLVSFGVRMTGWALLAPVGLLSILLLGFALGTLLNPAALLFRDLQRTLGIVTGLLFFATPVVYAPTAGTPLSRLIMWNPLTPLLGTTRELLTATSVSQPVAFILVSGCACLLFGGGWILNRLALPHIVSRFSNR